MNPKNGTLTLILGGVRSGKSRFGEELAASLGGDSVLYVATAQVHDNEMKDRVARHQADRPGGWKTFECPVSVGQGLLSEPFTNSQSPFPNVVLVDCLTLLVTNRLCERDLDRLDGKAIEQIQQTILDEVSQLVQLSTSRGCHVIIVSGEVGSGIVPEFKSGRVFRDLLGWANQYLAKYADAIYLLIAGCAIPLHEHSVSASDAGTFLKSRLLKDRVPLERLRS